jgi:hypothetical protein
MAAHHSTSGAEDIDASGLHETPDPATGLHPVADKIFRPARLAKLACLIGLSVFLPYLIQHLPNLAGRPEYRVQTSMIRVIPSPVRPVPPDLIDQVRIQSQLPRDLSLLDAKLCPNLAAAFEKHPWVARVISVKQSFPADVTVELEYRQPVATAQVKGGRLPIDGEGMVLPSEDFAAADVPKYPTIRLQGGGSLFRTGDRITDAGLSGAAALARLLSARWTELELDAIELPRLTDSTTKAADIILQLHTRSGSTIIWGRAPGTSHPGELTAPQKLARLEKYHAEFGGFDRPNGPYEIDIRHWQEITRRHAGKAQASRRETRTHR